MNVSHYQVVPGEIMKTKACFTLTPEVHDVLRDIAKRNKMKMSQVVELLILGNKDTRFVVKGVRR